MGESVGRIGWCAWLAIMTAQRTPIHASPEMLARFNSEDLDVVTAHIRHCERRHLSSATIKQRVSRLAQISDHYPNQSILEVTGEQLEELLDQLRGNDGGPLLPSSRRGFVSILRTFFRWAVDYDYLARDPMRLVVTPKIPDALPRPIPERELQLAINEAPTPLLKLWLLLAASAGLRAGEISGLLWDNVDIGDGFMRVVGKGNKTRVVPIAVELVEPLIEHERTRSGSEFVFADSVFDRGFSPAQVTKIMSKYLAEVGLPYTAHSLRHRFGTEACESSGDIRGVQDLMGHSSMNPPHRVTGRGIDPRR